MIKLFFRQIFFIVTSFLGLTIITFYLNTLAPDPKASAIVNPDTAEVAVTTGEVIVASEIPLYLQYYQYLRGILHGDLGISSSTRTAVTDEFMSHLPASIELVVLASIMAILIGIPLGIIASMNHRKKADIIINNVSLIAYSMPIFWWGIILIMFFSLNLGVTPVAGRLSFLFDIEPVTGFILIDTFISEESYRMDAFKDALHHLILPVSVLATLPAAIIARIVRQTMLETMSEDYILTAQAKGLSRFRIYWIHGFRNALIPFTNMLGLQISTLMTGAMLTEYLFTIPGIGKWMLDALVKNDFQSLQGGILITTTLVIFINSALELLQLWLNPKRRVKTRIYNA